MELSNFSYLVLIFLLLWTVVSLWLNSLQTKAAKDYNILDEFKDIITKEDAKKASEYNIEKLKLNNIEISFAVIVFVLWTFFGGINILNNALSGLELPIIILGALNILFFILIGGIINLPFSIYRTFVIEQKFGFNQTTVKTFIGDSIKTLLLSLILGMPLLILVLYLIQAMGDLWWFGTWIALSGFSLLILWLYPSFIAPLFNKFEKLENVTLASKIDDLLQKTGFKSNGLFVMDGSKRSSHGNAYFTGFGKNKRIVFFDTLLKGMNDNQVLAVLAHELGHFHHKHILKNIITSFVSTLIYLFILGLLINKAWFYEGLGVADYSYYNGIILFILILPIFSFFITPILNLISRKHEYEADSFAVKNTSATDLIGALTILYKDNAALTMPNKIYSSFYDSHPNAGLRIDAMKSKI